MRRSTLSIVTLTMGLLALCPAKGQSQNSPFTIQRKIATLDEQPRFPGCEIPGAEEREKMQCAEGKLETYIKENLKYPASAKGKEFVPVVVWIEMTVEMNGRVHSPKVAQPGVQEYDENAQSVFVQMTRSDLRWIPGISLGRAVRSQVKIAVHFSWEGRNKAFPGDSNGGDIYKMVDNVPAFTSCRVKGKKDEEIMECVDKKLDEFFSTNLKYPDYALNAGMEGDVQVEFVVGKDSMVHSLRISNDIDLSHDPEINRLFHLMNEQKIGWLPGEENGEQVNVLVKTKIPFKIKNKSRSVTMMTSMDPKPLFVTGRGGFEAFMNTYLKRPEGEEVSPCAFGAINVQFRINQLTGDISISEMEDYNNLGSKFQVAAEKFLQETNGLWHVTYPSLGPETQYFVLIPFESTSTACQNVPPGYKEALYKSIEAAAMTDNGATFSQGMEILDKAVRLYPTDNEIRLLRGMALYKNGHVVEGCVDLKFVNKHNKDIEVPKSCRN